MRRLFTNSRSFADLERGDVKRALLVGQNSVYEASRNLIEVFSSQLETLYIDWDQFHRAYDIFQETSVEEASEEDPAPYLLDRLLSKFGPIVDQVRKLPDTSLTPEIAIRSGQLAVFGHQRLQTVFGRPAIRRNIAPAGCIGLQDLLARLGIESGG